MKTIYIQKIRTTNHLQQFAVHLPLPFPKQQLAPSPLLLVCLLAYVYLDILSPHSLNS